MFYMLGLINNVVNVACNCLRITGGGTRFMGKSNIFDSYVELLDKKEKFPLGFEYEMREMFIKLFQEHKKLIEINDRVNKVYKDLRSYSVRVETIDADIQNLKNTIGNLKKNINECNNKFDMSNFDLKEKNKRECKKSRNLECLEMLNKTIELFEEDKKQEVQNILEKSKENLKVQSLADEYSLICKKLLDGIVDKTKVYSTLSPECLEKKLLVLLE